MHLEFLRAGLIILHACLDVDRRRDMPDVLAEATDALQFVLVRNVGGIR